MKINTIPNILSDTMPNCPICSSVRRTISLKYQKDYDVYDCGCGYAISTLGLKTHDSSGVGNAKC
jgi:hypothetical protein